MPLFALPITASSAKHSHPRTLHASNNPHKRKRSTDPSSSSGTEQESNDEEPQANSTNPLSLRPAEIIQYRLAGLRLDEELPSSRIEGWPHRGFGCREDSPERRGGRGRGRKGQRGRPDINTDGERGGGEEDEKLGKRSIEGKKTGPRLRTQHLQVLVAILQKCLMENDIQRAGRAWALLVRAQVGGQGVDVRGTGYWGVGVEVLMRSLEGRSRKGKEVLWRGRKGENGNDVDRRDSGDWGWGSKEGLDRAKEYFERLIVQHPYKRHWDSYVSAIDFWPHMVACEIYGIQKEYMGGMEKIRRLDEGDDGNFWSGSEENAGSDFDAEDGDEGGMGWATEQKRKGWRSKRRRERWWGERDEIRTTALSASEDIARRLDEVMMMPPFSDSHDMLRLRGMLALYIGDLSVCGKPKKGDGEIGTEERFLFMQRMRDWERGLGRRRGMFEVAESFFERISNEGGEKIKMPRFEIDDDKEGE